LRAGTAQECRDFLDGVFQPDAIGEIEEIHLRPFLAGVSVWPIINVPRLVSLATCYAGGCW
jgi:hypothetical protein